MPCHLVICIILLMVASFTRLTPNEVFIYDKHMNRALMAYSGSKWHIQYAKAYAGTSASLIHKTTTTKIWTGQLDVSGSLEIPISADQQSPNLGQYTLIIGGGRNITFTISYSLCPDTSNECQNIQKCAKNDFCMQFLKHDGKPKTKPCKVPAMDMCNFHGKLTICGTTMAVETLCHALASKKLMPKFARLSPMKNALNSCSLLSSPIILIMTKDSKRIELGTFFFRPPNVNNLKVFCYNRFVSCLSTASSKEAGPKCKEESCAVEVKNLLPESSPGASMTLRVKSDVAFSYIHIVDMPVEVEFVKISACVDLRCAVKMDDSDKRFRAKWTIHHNGTVINQSAFEPPLMKVLKVDKRGTYNCTVKIRFRSCSPFNEQFVTLNSSLIVQDSDFDKAACENFVAQNAMIGGSEDSGGSSSTTIIVVVVLLIVLGLVVASGVAIYQFRHKLVFRPQKVQKKTPAKKSSPMKNDKSKQNISVVSFGLLSVKSKKTGDRLTLPPMSAEDMTPAKGTLKR